MSATLLVELFCEELPPKALKRLGDAFAQGIASGLRKRQLVGDDAAVKGYATPRRLAVTIEAVERVAPDSPFEEKLMPVSVGLDASGNATPALQKKLAARQLSHVPVANLQRMGEGKAEQLVYRGIAKGPSLQVGLQSALDETLEALPIPKVMSYQLADGQTTVHFVRPAHGLVALHGRDIVPVTALGLSAGRIVHGHRFEGARDIALESAAGYADALRDAGAVIPDFDARRADIRRQLDENAARLDATLGAGEAVEALLDEVTALVERPTVYAGTFEPEFLAVPAECLVLTMRQNQKYFPLFDRAGKLTNRFLIVSNLRPDDPSAIVGGNERVVRPRLADARFFFLTDEKQKLADRVPQLRSIVYHNKLGTQLERVERLRRLATRIQAMLPRGEKGRPYADRAALLAKADLVTLMVGEFPELQGLMGRYYAEHDGEEPSVVRAIEQHYWPRFSGDHLPSGDVSVALALADKLETLVGIWGVGQQPTGDKDPFGLRRAALGALRILSEKPEAAALDLRRLLDEAAGGFAAGKLAADTPAQVHGFMLDRLRSLLRDRGYDANEIESVLADNPTSIHRVWTRIEAVRAFRALPEAESLASANKRIRNILRKSGSGERVTPELLAQDEERRLHSSLQSLAPRVEQHLERQDFAAALKDLAGLRADVDAFFDKVLVNAEDEKVRANRLALLTQLGILMNRVADISKLAV
ncbi:MAG TPA: glycine--tRNA ligase subunit beta [Usitatibacter sp.]|jgi:glycyl-tRNA synthetase beta chain|nr:glycine--tRNA ligase subunit beta [Usitatibacter sp.]